MGLVSGTVVIYSSGFFHLHVRCEHLVVQALWLWFDQFRPLDVDACVISSAYFALAVKECPMSNCGKLRGYTRMLSIRPTRDPMIVLGFHVRLEVDETSNVLFHWWA